MGIEVGDGSVEPMADKVRSDDPVAALVGFCESLDLGDQGGQVEDKGPDEEVVVADSNGHLTEEEAARSGLDDAATPIESAPAAQEAADVPEGSRSHGQIKDWSDFNAVSARTFGDQSFGSFSDFLANQSDLPPDTPMQTSGAIELGSDIDFFEWGVSTTEPVEIGGMGAMTTHPEPPVEALPECNERPLETGSTIAVQEEAAPAPVSADGFFGIGQESSTTTMATMAQVPFEETFVSEDVASAEASSSSSSAAAQGADPYPGWYYDYDAGEWRAIEGYNSLASVAENAGYGGDYVDSHHVHHMQTISETGAFQQEGSPIPVEHAAAAGGVAPAAGLEQPLSWDSQSAATQTAADEYPGWKWDYATQAWVASPDYSEPWQSTNDTQSQVYSEDQSWYAQQEQQTQTYDTASAHVSPFADQPLASSVQSQSFFSERVSNSASMMTNGYSTPSFTPANTGSGFMQEAKQWQGDAMHNSAAAAAGEASNFYTPQMNGDHSWPAPAFNKQEQLGSQSMPSVSYPLSDAYYSNYAANGGPHNYAQQAWGNAPHLNQYQQYTNPTAPPPKNVQEALRTCSGRPPHSLAAFGFGGKFIFMKHRDPVTLHTSDGDQAFASGEAWMPGPIQVSNLKTHLPQESTFAGPLNGGGVSAKELIKWIDERASSQPISSRLLLGVLKVACQHYGKLRSASVNSGNSAVEEDGPEAALAKLLTSAVGEQNPYAALTLKNLALRGVPSEQLLQTTALEVKKLLVCGKRKDALKCAQEGELWSIALVVARQLGEKYFCDTVTEMARRQFVPGSPLRTLSLLLAGQPAEVFATPSLQSANLMGGVSGNQSQDGHEAMLDDWQENLAIMAANRTQGDERVMLYLGDRLWSVRGEVAAAHLCYLVADANLESYSENARLCLIGADHCKFPRTFVTPEAIQRTEIYEYAKVLGNPQSILISFQPYKLAYAEMLVECGKTAESLRYCQTVLKTLKAAGMRGPEVEACKILATNMEERLRVHIQDGHGSKLAPGKLVKGLFDTIDRGISRIIGGPPPSVPPSAADSFAFRPSESGDHFGSQSSRPGYSTGTRSGAPMAPSASIAASMERLPPEPNRGPPRSQSEPDFGRNAKQGDSEVNSGVSPRAVLRLGMVGRLGSTFLQKATGFWGSSKKEAKLGDANKFYYDEKLKKWVEEGVDPTPDIAPPPPPPTTSSFMGTLSPQEETHVPPQAVTLKPGTPPLAPNSSNHYSNRRQAGVRSRYVDTFNKGVPAAAAAPAKSVMGSLIPPPMPSGTMMSSPAMFVPSPVPSTSSNESNSEVVGDNFLGGALRNGDANLGPLLDTASSNPSSSYPMMPTQLSTSDNGPGTVNSGSAVLRSHGEPSVFRVAHTRSSSWSGYPSTLQNPLVPGDEDDFGASFSGHDRLTGSHAPSMSMSMAPTSYTKFYLPDGNGPNISMPPPPSGVPSAAGDIRDPSRPIMGQQFRGSQSVDSLTGEEMQEVEL